MKSAYYDANYLFKFQFNENGLDDVRKHASTVDVLVCSLHGRAKVVSAGHCKLREGDITKDEFAALIQQLSIDTSGGAIRWIPVSGDLIARTESVYLEAPAETFLRAADALHLAGANEHGFNEIYSNDRHLLAAAPLFSLKGVNVIAK